MTANKLKSLTQARRFGAPSGKGGGKSIDPHKAVTQCKICGQTGHWHRECPNNKGGTKPPAPTKGKGAHKGTSGKPGKPGMRQVHVTEETEAPDEEHEAFFVYAVLYRCPEVMLASASTSHGYMIVDTACQRTCHGQGWMEQHLELLKAKGQTWLPQYRSCEKTDWFQFGAGGPVKATGITRLPCATDGKHYLIDSCELTAGIPMLGSLKLLKALGTVLDLPAETAYLSKLQVTVPLRRLENGHLALSLLDSEEDFPETDSWEVVSKELVLPPFARRQEKNRQKVLTFRLDQGEEAEALSTETPDLELQYNFNTDLCRRLGSSGQAQLGEGVPWKVWNNTQEDGARRASASVAAVASLAAASPPPDPPTGAPRPASPETRAKPGKRGVAVPRLSGDWSTNKRCSSCGPGSCSAASGVPVHAQEREEVRQPARQVRCVPEPGVRTQAAVRRGRLGAWREFYSLSQQQLPHPSEGPILPAKAKARAKTVASHGYGMTPKARPAPTTTARPSRRPQEFDMRSVASSSAASRRSMEEDWDGLSDLPDLPEDEEF